MKTEEPLEIIPYLPTIYRFLDKRWVDDFFNSGTLLLSSFLKLRPHQDEKEGVGSISYTINGNPVDTELEVGRESFVLCASLMYSPQLYQDFKCDSCLVIENPLKFACHIAQTLQAVERVFFGPCNYLPDRKIIKTNVSKDRRCMSDADYDSLFMDVVPDAAVEVLFRKELKFQYQHEFRFVWDVAPDCYEKEKLVKIPEARSLCRFIDKNS